MARCRVLRKITQLRRGQFSRRRLAQPSSMDIICEALMGITNTRHYIFLASVLLVLPLDSEPRTEVWRFDRLDSIGGFQPTVLGHPKIIKTPMGRAMQFNGVDDALFLPKHPLAGADMFTFEAIFRPESGGAAEQRWFHLAEQDPKTNADTGTRLMFEIRIVGQQWCLDAFVHTPAADKALLDLARLHPLDKWYQVAMVYNGAEFRSYVNGMMEGSAALRLEPQGPGRASVGTRIDKTYYFKGSILEARFTPRALKPDEFLRLP
jgi:Concanavalin A-like lectin/glucanases superfamily